MDSASTIERGVVEADEPIVIAFRLNGAPVTAEVFPRQHLAQVLRETFQLTGTHLGCEQGVCGACNILLDGQAARACLLLAIQADGGEVVTVEGLHATGDIADLQEAFIRRNALQCGFCTSGMLITAHALLQQEAAPTRAGIRETISGNICRCTGYHAIVDAIETVADARRGDRDAS
jgi:carbon-monoxide dehydrogenase small subunit